MEYEDEVGEPTEQEEFDADMAYERYRDDWSDKLTEVLTDTYNMFVRAKEGYYKDSDEKFVEHCIATLTFMTGTEVVMNGKHLSVRKKENGKEKD